MKHDILQEIFIVLSDYGFLYLTVSNTNKSEIFSPTKITDRKFSPSPNSLKRFCNVEFPSEFSKSFIY